jgi:amino acid adenylation domain-containing protein
MRSRDILNVIMDHGQSARGHTAISTEHQDITYGALISSAHVLAKKIHPGLSREWPVVGIALEDPAKAVVAILATLMAGGAYLPLNPQLPAARFRSIADEASIDLVVAETSHGADFLPQGTPLLVFDSWPEDSSRDDLNAPDIISPDVDPEMPACLYYTSGSTGKPNGVVMSRHALSSYIENIVKAWEIGPGDRFLQFSSLAWATSGEEIFAALTGGATLVSLPSIKSVSLSDFLSTTARERITILDLPTSYWRELVYFIGDAWVRLPSCVRLAVIGGDKLDEGSLARWFSSPHTAGTRLINTYGSTEFGLALQVELDGSTRAEEAWELIGRPLPGVRAYVDGVDLDTTPPGTTGELSIGGATLADRYLNNESLTTMRFESASGERRFRTRDLVRVCGNHELAFVGRLDRQVKIRGYRVDLNEVDSVLSAALETMVASVAVTGKDDQTLLVSLVEGPSEAMASRLSGVRKSMSDKLPAYAQPDRIHVIERLPRLSSGKADLQTAYQIADHRFGHG